jgi:hypothetical protein
MFSKRTIIVLLAVVMMVAAGAFTVSAQDDSNPTWRPFGGMGRGMGMGVHLMWDGDAAPMFSIVADALGIDAQTLISELQSGKTLAQLAEEKGIDLATVTAAAQTTMQQHLGELVAAGVLTQAQADARLNLMQQHWEDASVFNGTCCGGMTMGMGRGGMWGNGDSAQRGRMGRGG